MKRWWLSGLFALALVGGVAHAQDGANEDATNEDSTGEPSVARRATGFRTVTGPDQEQVPGGTLLLIAYGAAWLLVAGYAWRLGGLHRDTAADVEALRRSLESHLAAGGTPPAEEE